MSLPDCIFLSWYELVLEHQLVHRVVEAAHLKEPLIAHFTSSYCIELNWSELKDTTIYYTKQYYTARFHYTALHYCTLDPPGRCTPARPWGTSWTSSGRWRWSCSPARAAGSTVTSKLNVFFLLNIFHFFSPVHHPPRSPRAWKVWCGSKEWTFYVKLT